MCTHDCRIHEGGCVRFVWEMWIDNTNNERWRLDCSILYRKGHGEVLYCMWEREREPYIYLSVCVLCVARVITSWKQITADEGKEIERLLN